MCVHIFRNLYCGFYFVADNVVLTTCKVKIETSSWICKNWRLISFFRTFFKNFLCIHADYREKGPDRRPLNFQNQKQKQTKRIRSDMRLFFSSVDFLVVVCVLIVVYCVCELCVCGCLLSQYFFIAQGCAFFFFFFFPGLKSQC